VPVLDDALASPLADSGHVVLNVRDPDTLLLTSDVRRIGGRRTVELEREALKDGRRVVKLPGQVGLGGGGRNFATLTVLDPSRPFTIGQVRAVLELWGGRVYSGEIGLAFSPGAYDQLRAETANSDPVGQWSVRFRSLGVRDATALEASNLTPSVYGEFGVGSVTEPSGERIDLVLVPDVRSYRIRAYAYALDTDVAGVLARLLGDAGVVDTGPAH
jgi:hypothetical protein